jgi:hypothetical protein
MLGKRSILMKKNNRFNWLGLILTVFLFFSITAPALAGEVTLIGEVNDSYQLESNGQIYEIADTPKGNDLAENYISAKVKVTGTIEAKNDMKTITVSDFQVVPE